MTRGKLISAKIELNEWNISCNCTVRVEEIIEKSLLFCPFQFFVVDMLPISNIIKCKETLSIAVLYFDHNHLSSDDTELMCKISRLILAQVEILRYRGIVN